MKRRDLVTKPDRLARSTRNLLDIMDDLDKRGIALVVLSMGGQRIDTRKPDREADADQVGRRRGLRARPDAGAAARRDRAAAAGKYKGRAPTARAKATDVLRLAKAGRTRDAIAADLGIGVASVYLILADARATGAVAA
jgi:DNA invertase Pin-like site-specific DNA recombinase